MLVIVLLLGCMTPFAAADETSPGKIINVVYDDSRSMYLNNETRWCQAKYAMEVFCAMIGENDVMNIYAMNRPETLTLRGDDPSRVEQVHAMTSRYSGTPFSTVKAAGSALKKEDEAYERWLVVLTDGSFDSTAKATVQSTLNSYNDAGIKTVYLAIGNDAVELESDPSRGAYAEKAVDTKDILAKVTSIANQIFEHQVLGGAFIEKGEKTTLNIDIPTEQIVIFAQGEGAKVGRMTLNGRTLAPTQTQNVRHSGDVMPLNDEKIQVDTTLYGVVVTYEAGDTPFEDGQFIVEVSDATTVEYYYRPGVEINCELRYGGRAVQTGDEFYAGEYEVALNFIDPLKGKVVDSELLADAEFTLRVVNNGQEQIVSSKSGSVTLTQGDVDIHAKADLPGNVSLKKSRSYGVLPEPIMLRLEFVWTRTSYSVDQLGERAVPVTLRVNNEATGAALTKEEWAATQIKIQKDEAVNWNVVPGTETGTWELRPLSAAASLKAVETGAFDFDVTADYQLGNQYAYGAETLSLTVTEYVGNQLEISIAEPAAPYDLNDMDEPAGIPVTVRYLDPQSGMPQPLTAEMWETMKLKASSEQRVDWTLEKGSEVGSWMLTPEYYAGDPLMTDSGIVPVQLTAEADAGEYKFSGEESRDVEFKELSKESFLRILLPRLIIALFLLWLIIGYLKKKRLRTRGLNPRCSFKGTTSPKQKISKDFFSVVLPYVPEKATVKCHKSAFQCNFPDLRIQAVGRRSFRIINKTLPLKTTKICGEFYSDMETLRKRNFSFGSFDITTVNPKANNKSMGTFTFN